MCARTIRLFICKYGRVALFSPCVGMQTMLHRPAPLTVAGVYKTLRQIAVQKGQGSAARRQQAVLGMLRSCRYMASPMMTETINLVIMTLIMYCNDYQ